MDLSLARKEVVVSGGPESVSASRVTLDPKEVETHPTFVDLLPVSQDMLENLIQGMRADGYYESEPIVLGTWQGQEGPVLIDGHMRMRAAVEVGITEVPFVVVEFPDEAAAVSHAISLQTKRRTTTDAALYRLQLQEGGQDTEDSQRRHSSNPGRCEQ